MRLFFTFLTFFALFLSADETDFLASSDLAVAHARELLDVEKSEEALVFVEEARVYYNDDPKILIFGGDAAFNLGDVPLAKQYYQSALNITSEDAIEAIIQDHIEGGYQKEAAVILEDARGLYPTNADLLVFSGRVAYELDDLTTAKNYYLLALELDANNEIAAANIKNIEKQEEAQENKVVSGVLEYLGDKGLDFLMIFLAFLGGELLAKRYIVCESKNAVNSVNSYMNKKYASTYKYRRKLVIRPFCFFATLLNYMTVAGALLIVWLFINISSEILIDLTIMTKEGLFLFAVSSYFVIFLSVSVISLLILKYKETRGVEEQFMDTVENLQKIALEGQYVILKEACHLVKSHESSDIEVKHILDQCYSEEAEAIIKRAFEDIKIKKA
ncbi:MAG: hypothetical protein WBF77_03385 [Sulfurimonadaceae bacterium]